MSALDDLLRVQDHDTAADRIRHRKQTLPAREELSAVEVQLATLESRMSQLGDRRNAVADRQTRREAELAAVEERIAEVEGRMYSGEVSASRELQAMLAEVDHLKVRRSALEDEALTAMEEAEPLTAELMVLEGERRTFVAQRERLRVAIADEERALDAEMTAEQSARCELARGLPAGLLETYERLRSKHGGVGAARLMGNSCSGCHLSLPLSEVARIKREPPDAVVLCDQCGRILVR